MPDLDRFESEYQSLKNSPLALLSNYASITSAGSPSAVELVRRGFSIKKIFTPEHGLTSQGEDGKKQISSTDPLTGIQTASLYGETLRPLAADLEDIAAVLVDLPNLGCRFYTYWWTITHMAEACSNNGKELIVLDRPNLSRRSIKAMEGPLLDEQHCSSFLGRWTMPLTYSFSYGELLSWFVHQRKIDLNLTVIPYSPDEIQSMPFIPPSPSINEWQAAALYPFTGLFEGLNLNTGRGTSFPFRVLGAPWIDMASLFDDFMKQNFAGLKAYPYAFLPEWSRYEKETCYGLYFHIDDPYAFRPVMTGLWLMNYLSHCYPDMLSLATYPTVANPNGLRHLDLLLGVQNAFEVFCKASISNSDIHKWLNISQWTDEVVDFLRSR